jgi:hypothetical protein
MFAASRGVGGFSIDEATGRAQITTKKRYLHWARGLADGAAYRPLIEIACWGRGISDGPSWIRVRRRWPKYDV